LKKHQNENITTTTTTTTTAAAAAAATTTTTTTFFILQWNFLVESLLSLCGTPGFCRTPFGKNWCNSTVIQSIF
jgi:hypothetical protein